MNLLARHRRGPRFGALFGGGDHRIAARRRCCISRPPPHLHRRARLEPPVRPRGGRRGGVAMASRARPHRGLVFALGSALPAWWLAYLALLGRPPRTAATEWYPLGRLLLWIAATAALITSSAIVAIGDGELCGVPGTPCAARSKASSRPQARRGRRRAAPRSESLSISWSQRAALPLRAQFRRLILTLNLWLAGKIVAGLGSAAPPLAGHSGDAMPRRRSLLLAAHRARGSCPGFAGVLRPRARGALSRRLRAAGPGLHPRPTRGSDPAAASCCGGLYVLALLARASCCRSSPLFGLADTVFGLRRRFGPGSAGPQPPST